jgi:hypothetical protein
MRRIVDTFISSGGGDAPFEPGRAHELASRGVGVRKFPWTVLVRAGYGSTVLTILPKESVQQA